MKATKRDIRQGLEAIKKVAVDAFEQNDLTRSLKFIRAYVDIAGQFNFEYSDLEMELLLSAIAKKRIKTEAWDAEEGHWLFYDDFCTSYVLGLQWLEALASSGKEILYITTRDLDRKSRHKYIYDSAEQYSNVHCVVVPQGETLRRAQDVYNEIARFKPSKVILHKSPALSVVNFVLPVLPESVKKYIINLSDQTFWYGSQVIDYCLEFRDFGASVSLQRRGLKKEQLLMVPFYPADDGIPFAGFPPECTDDKLIVFSGGDYYKTLDEGRTYWRLVKRLLDTYPQIVFLFATKNIPEGDAEIKRFIADNNFEDRFLYIKFRPDINQVFEHCDIYMGTCPTSGSLMSQLAALHSKPILQYYAPGTPDDETEQAICINTHFPISCYTEEAFLAEADRLIVDLQYRRSQGEQLRKAMMQKEQFNQLALKTIESNQTQINFQEIEINYDDLDKRWYYLEKAGYIHSIPYIYSLLGPKECLKKAPSIFFKKNLKRIINE